MRNNYIDLKESQQFTRLHKPFCNFDYCFSFVVNMQSYDGTSFIVKVKDQPIDIIRTF